MPLKVSQGIKSWIDDFQQSKDKRFDGKSAEKRREMAIAAYMAAKREQKENVKTADKKPEMFTKPDGKRGTRMVPVDREVVKREKNLEWLKAALEAQARKTKPCDEDIEETAEAIDMSKVGTKATIMHPVTRVSKKVDKKDVQKHVDSGWLHMSQKRNRITKSRKEATIPDGQTAMTKKPEISKKDKETVGKIQALMKRANESNVDEISKGMASRYIKKSQVSTADAAKSVERGNIDSKSPDRDIAKAGKAQAKKGIKTFINRNKGTSTAVDKLTGKAKVPAKEGMAQGIAKQKISREKEMDARRHDRMMDRARMKDVKKKNMSELSNNKMGQYVRKAADDAAKKGAAGDTKKAQARVKGVSKAMDKIDHNRLFGRSGTTYSGYKK